MMSLNLAFKKFFVFVILCLLLLNSCMTSPYYQKTVTVPQNEWGYNFQPSFHFEITDTSSYYNLYFLIRHTDAYPYANIWLNIYTKEPSEKTFQQSRIEIPLAETGGKWLGRGMNEIWEQRMAITRNDAPMIFKKKGVYEIRLEQNMRINPLPEVLNVGLRVEKIGIPKK
jgi:gliding motility-associated lipoprotein GldH